MLLYIIADATEIKTLKGRFRISVTAFEGFLSTLGFFFFFFFFFFPTIHTIYILKKNNVYNTTSPTILILLTVFTSLY